MKSFIKIFLLISFVSLTGISLAQSKIDSLKILLKKSDVKNKIEIYYQISSLYLDVSPDSAIKYADLGLLLIDSKNGLKRKNDYIWNLGYCYEVLNKHKIALKYLQQAQEGYGKENNKQKLIITTNSIGIVYIKTSYYDKALSNFQHSLTLSYGLNDTLQICNSLTSMGLVYQAMKEYKPALSNFEKVLDLATKLNIKITIADALNNISNIYNAKQDYKKALIYYMKSLDMYKKSDKKENVAIVTANIGEVYKKLNNLDVALIYFEKAYQISKNNNNKFLTSYILYNNEYLISYILYNIGDIYFLKKNYDKAKDYMEKAENIAVEVENKEVLKSIYELYSRLYSYKNNYKKALEYYMLYKKTNDSIYTIESRNKVSVLQVEFDIQEKVKENEILLQKTEIQQLAINTQIYLRNTFIYISIIVTLLVIFIFYLYWIKQRANKILTEKNGFINLQKEELEEVYKTKDKLFSILTHDLKNPFGSLVALSTFLESNYSSLDENHRYKGIESLKRSIVEIYTLLENLTDWLNSKGNNIILSKTNFDLSETITSVVKLYSVPAEQKSINISIQIDPPVFVFGDERMIKTVIRNLIDNAIKFSQCNGDIEIEVKEKQDGIIVSIKDYGIGIKETNKHKLFNLETHFSTTGTLHESGGGLGLILSKEFIEKNKGEIWFESEVGKGSTFYFLLIKGYLYDEN